MSWIEERTNKSDEYWVARVQQLISENTVTAQDEKHGETDPKWVTTLVEEVISNLPPPDPPYDGNMGIAARLAYIFGLWFASCQLAKCFDSHRPTYVRQKAYGALLDYKEATFTYMVDLSKLPTYFPGQPWQLPHDPNAKGGDFL